MPPPSLSRFRFGVTRGAVYRVPEKDRPLTMGDFGAAHDLCIEAGRCVHGGPCPHEEVPDVQ